MSLRTRSILMRGTGVACLLAIAIFSLTNLSVGGFGAVGGVMIDTNGVLRNATVQESKALKERREALLKALPDSMEYGGMRRISLARLQQSIADRSAAGEAPVITEEMQYMGGMTRIQFVFAVPEENDIILVGPAEQPVVDGQGNVVGAKTGAPILQLDHFLQALRTAEATAAQPITCSIDPTEEGLRKFQQYMRGVRGAHANLERDVEAALGPQKVTIQGVSLDSELARTLIAADYRMKRIAMGHEPSNVRGIQSYVEMMASAGRTTPRWWLAPKYDAVVRDEAGLSWELRGQGVQVMTEDSILVDGQFQQQNQRNRRNLGKTPAQRFADQMTQNYEELSTKHPIFGELRGVMDMAVITAMITKNDLSNKAGLDLSVLMDAKEVPTKTNDDVPEMVKTKASVLAKRGETFITASGGVEINSWKVVDEQVSEGKIDLTTNDIAPLGDHWWWD